MIGLGRDALSVSVVEVEVETSILVRLLYEKVALLRLDLCWKSVSRFSLLFREFF